MNSQTDGHTTTSEITENNEVNSHISADEMRENFTDGAEGGETGSHVNVQLPGGNIQFAGSQNSLGNNHSFMSASAQYHRLPKLSLPKFNGDILSWQTFWDSFESTVHLNCNLTDVQKFSYLKSQLEGEANRTIDGFALTNTNYARATELLKERYGQKHKIIHATMQSLLQLPAPKNTLHYIREFYDKMETYIRALESLGQQQESYGDLLVPIVLDKLPGEMTKNLARGHGDRNWLLCDLRRAIYNEINIMEAGSYNSIQPEVETYGSTASLFTGARSTRVSNSAHVTRTGIKCSFCMESHRARNCRKYPDVASKLNVIKEKKLCFNCLGKHQVFTCKSTKRCQNCNRKHHTTICKSDSGRNSSARSSTQHTSEATVMYSSAHQFRSGVLLKTAMADVCYKDICSPATILFDEGAQRSFITETLADELQLEREKSETIRISAFGGKGNQMQHFDQATVYLVTDRKKKIPLKVLIVPTIATLIDNTHSSDISSLPYLKGLKLAHPVTHDKEFSISLLIGADFYWDIVEDEIIRGTGPTAVKSKIGYLLSGPINSSKSSRSVEQILNVMVSHIPEDISIERFWSLENLGITPDDTDRKLQDERQQYQLTSIEFKDGKYTARLPWKTDHPELPTNYDIVLKRTESTVRRLSREPDMLRKYGDIIVEQERRGFIERVQEKEIQTKKPIHYIPHHPIKKNSSTTPIRIVYDCSCRKTSHHASLNDCLQSTPPVLNELTSILLRSCLHAYAVTTDIEKAFLQVGLHTDDRDMTRFLWLKDPNDPNSDFSTYRFKVVLFGSPFILNATILKHLDNNPHTTVSEVLRQDLYVDNVIYPVSKKKKNALIT
ncbi:uncharacterized protein LOC132727352 [Ruditapes philippinarum]|uniref:uncharacterized protein LOC132727352 n=1 Tax=Ruditapes philippinarum TaxID=129788 RepID=UPI00295B2F72|nr:uncharacterized protein LOC132727352 [Ruditapes philippinarum]